ncbi:MAG: MazG nucleotide pyrophosphohydrolase domain-containing protein [Pseudomonadota bacterium]
MLFLKHSPSLCDFQNYVHALEIERGFAHENLAQKCLLLGEEIGELCEAIRQYASQSVNSVAGELADVLIILFSMANRLETTDAYTTLQKHFLSFIHKKNTSLSFSQMQQIIPSTSHTTEVLCLQLVEKNGLLFKCIRKLERIKLDASSKTMNTDQKLAEVLLTLCQIANRFQLNLETLFREKEAINKTRKWQV